MTDIAKGILGGAWTLIAGWILPSALGLAAFGLTILPSIKMVLPFGGLADLAGVDQALVLLALSVLLGMTLSTLATPLYRILEGYMMWPKALQANRIEFHRKRRESLRGAVRHSNSDANELSLTDALSLEAFHRYPDATSQVAPTLFGNAIRRFEYYSTDRYLLDSQLLWSQLRGAAPETVLREVEAARAGVDFFVCLFYVSAGLAFTGVVSLLLPSRDIVALLIALTLGTLTALGSYRAATRATDAWSSAVRAMVDLARIPLAKALGLQLPATLEEERKMWLTVGWMMGFAYNHAGKAALDPYRIKASEPAGNDEGDGG